MQLTYRGVCYESNSVSAKIPVSKKNGIYRGTKFKFHTTAVVHQPQSSVKLRYRGISYNICQ